MGLKFGAGLGNRAAQRAAGRQPALSEKPSKVEIHAVSRVAGLFRQAGGITA